VLLHLVVFFVDEEKPKPILLISFDAQQIAIEEKLVEEQTTQQQIKIYQSGLDFERRLFKNFIRPRLQKLLLLLLQRHTQT